jgi:hypothetical protein
LKAAIEQVTNAPPVIVHCGFVVLPLGVCRSDPMKLALAPPVPSLKSSIENEELMELELPVVVPSELRPTITIFVPEPGVTLPALHVFPALKLIELVPESKTDDVAIFDHAPTQIVAMVPVPLTVKVCPVPVFGFVQ